MKLASNCAAVRAAGVPLPCAAVPRPVPGVALSRLAARDNWLAREESSRDWRGFMGAGLSDGACAAFRLSGFGAGGVGASGSAGASLGAGGALACATASGAADTRDLASTRSTAMGGHF